MFGFQRLDAYKVAVQALADLTVLLKDLPRGQADLADQLRRAALSIPLNIAEGSGKFGRDAIRFYTVARGSALECAAILDAIEALQMVEVARLAPARDHLIRVVSMLTRLVR